MSQRITPYLLYEDVDAALAWISRAFGFRETLRYADDEGTVNHAEMELEDGATIYLGHPGPDYRNPKRSGERSQLLVVQVDDVDAHCGSAREAGAVVLEEPEDKPYGWRMYRAEDPEGHHWSFGRQIADLEPEEWGAERAS